MKNRKLGKMVKCGLAMLLLAAAIVTVVPKFPGNEPEPGCSVCGGGSVEDFGDDVPRPTPVIQGC